MSRYVRHLRWQLERRLALYSDYMRSSVDGTSYGQFPMPGDIEESVPFGDELLSNNRSIHFSWV